MCAHRREIAGCRGTFGRIDGVTGGLFTSVPRLMVITAGVQFPPSEVDSSNGT